MNESEALDSRIRIPMLSLIPVVFLLPFLNKAYHVDDTLFLYAARQISASPWDFYGFHVNWYVTPQPMSEVMQNPPLHAYGLALVGALFGWDEWVLHTAMLVPAFAACWLIGLLAQRFQVAPAWAVLGIGLSPGFFVSASQVMCDVTFLALYLAAIYGWIRGLDQGKQRWLFLAALFAGMAFLTKYFGLSLIPLLAVYTVCRFFSEKSHGEQPSVIRLARSLTWLLFPALVALLYEMYTARLYGRGLLMDAIVYAGASRGVLGGGVARGLGGSLVYLSACLLLPGAWALFGLYRKQKLRNAAALAVLLGAGLLIFWTATQVLVSQRSYGVLVAVQWAFWFFLGVALLVPLWLEWYKHRNSDSVLLTFWLLGTLVFAGLFNHYVNARVLLPALAPATILVLRSFDLSRGGASRALLVGSCITLGSATLYIAAADQRLANTGRSAARDLLAVADPGRIWFTGHWGFQYYMEQGGARAVDFSNMTWESGDVLILPKNNGQNLRLPEAAIQRYEVRAYPVLQSVTTLSSEVGAGFYADSIGPLPYVAGPASAEWYGVVWLNAFRANARVSP